MRRVKTLHLIRHAKSSWDKPGLTDLERPLNARGKRACSLMAENIVSAGCTFEHVYTSCAFRAIATIKGINNSLDSQRIRWKVDEDLYTFNSQRLLRWCQALDDSLYDVVAIVHNPAITDFCNEMAELYIDNIPTCAYVQLSFAERKWRDIRPGSGKLVTLFSPKMLKLN